MSIKNALRELLNNLDRIYNQHGEVGDTAVREKLGMVIDDYFVEASPDDNFPLHGDYEMFTEEGNEEVHKVLGQFLNHPEVKAALTQLTPEERFNAFQDDDVESSDGSDSASYFGWGEYRPRS